MKLHLVNDEKIINRTIDIFEEVFPGENIFVVTNRTGAFKWVTKRDNVFSRTEFQKRSSDYAFTELYIHLLNRRKIDIINSLSLKNVSIFWIIWGLDLYNNLLAPKGFRMFAPSNSYLRCKKRLKLLNVIKSWQQSREAIRAIGFIKEKVDYIVTDTTDNDYLYLLKYYPELENKEWKDFFYYPLDVILGPELMNSSVCGNDLMIGNSASATNNHEYVIDIISKLDIGNRRVIVPLSYSGKKEYVESVIRLGENLLGENFTPLLKFTPLTEYNRIQASISVALFGNWRQEAIGNIIVALYLGAKVFLSSVNPVYEWAKSHGLVVYELESISQQDIDTPLEEAVKLNNREILSSLYTKERMIKLIRALVK